MDEDTAYVLKRIRAKEKIVAKKVNSAKDGKSSREITNKYLKELTPKLYEQLVEIYQVDFNIFGYDILPFEAL